MALSMGFPPSNLIGPGIRIAEKDLTFITPVQTGHRAGLVGFASKGPINTPVLVTSTRQLHRTFGYPHPNAGDPFLLYAAQQYLEVASELFVVRVADVSPTSDEQATTASVAIPTAGGAVSLEGNVAVDTGWVFEEDQFFRFRLNGVLSPNVLVVLSNEGDPYTATELVTALNDQIDRDFDGIEFYYTDADVDGDETEDSCLGVRTTFAYGTSATLELVSVRDALYGPDSVVGMGLDMTTAQVTGTAGTYPTGGTAGTFDFTGLTGLTLQVVVSGTDNAVIDDVVQVVTLTADSKTISQRVTEINNQIDDLPGGWVAEASGNNLRLRTLHHGRDAKLLVKPESTADALFGLPNLTGVGDSGDACVSSPGTTSGCAIASGSPNSGGTVCFTVYADSPGIDGNETQIVVHNHVRDGNFTLDVYSGNDQVEVWGPLTKDESSRFYVESYIAQVSEYIRIVDNTATLALPAPTVTAYELTGGTDGIPSDPDLQDEILIGSDVAMTGLQALSDPEQVDIDLISIPGHTSTAIVEALLAFCQQRQDCFAIVEAPFGLTVNEVVSWQNGTHPLNDARFDSDYGALYWPWLKIRDSRNRVDVWSPPSGAVMAAYARSDSISGPWSAPAGTRRGIVSGVLDAYSRPSRTERDAMQGSRNAVNPVIQFADVESFILFGQKTLQRRPTALDRVSVRRMLLYVEKRVRRAMRNLLFEPNDEALWGSFISISSRILDEVRDGRGLYDYRVQCDDTLNTPDVRDRNELRAKIAIQPARTAEFIFIEFSLHRTGTFSETSESF